jgi:hypothetical protein
MPGRSRRCLGEQLAHVSYLLGESRRALVAEQPAQLLQVRPTPGRVHDDELDVVEGLDEPSRERLALLEPPRVDGERPAAALRRRDNLVAVGGENTGGGGVHVREDGMLDAAGE